MNSQEFLSIIAMAQVHAIATLCRGFGEQRILAFRGCLRSHMSNEKEIAMSSVTLGSMVHSRGRSICRGFRLNRTGKMLDA